MKIQLWNQFVTPLIDKIVNDMWLVKIFNKFLFTIVASLVVNVVDFIFGFVHVAAKLDATRTTKVAKNNVRDIFVLNFIKFNWNFTMPH